MIGGDEDIVQYSTSQNGNEFSFTFNGQNIEVTYSTGPDHGIWAVFLDNKALLDQESGAPVTIDAYHPTIRYGESATFRAEESGQHILTVINTDSQNPQSQGFVIALEQIEVLTDMRISNIGAIIGLILIVEIFGLIFSLVFGRLLFSRLAQIMNTKRSILLALFVYLIIAIWGFFINAVVEFWFLAWMVAVVQGGSQALSRSLYASMSPASKSGEFFGLFGIMEKFSAVIGPLLFAAAAVIFGSSRPAILSLIIFFIVGGLLLTQVDTKKGKKIALQEDAAFTDSSV